MPDRPALPAGRRATAIAAKMRTTMNTDMPPRPHVRATGAGPTVVCLHANASSSAQWRHLSELLAPRFRVIAPDLYGAGASPEWPSDRAITLADEVALLEPVLGGAEAPFALVGHSYGAAVALKAALFARIEQASPRPNDADGIRAAVEDASAALDAADRAGAARSFVDYWSGAGTWDTIPEQRKPQVAAQIANVRRWRHALFGEPTPLAAFASLDIPVLYLSGARSTASARGVTRLLAPTLPRVELVDFAELGHMGPVTDPETVDPVITAFLDRVHGAPPATEATSTPQ